MLFGHIGITAGVVKACDIFASMNRPVANYEPHSSSKSGTVIGRERLRPQYLLNGIKGRISTIDYRMVLLGSLLPDIIDKPVWFLVTSLTDGIVLSGRGYAHTLLFSLVLLIGGLVLVRYRRSWLLIISLSSFIHLILDQMWNSRVVLLWPLLGPLPEEETTGWLSDIIQWLFSRPGVYIPEIIGLVIVLLFACRVVMRKGVISFIKGGVIG